MLCTPVRVCILRCFHPEQKILHADRSIPNAIGIKQINLVGGRSQGFHIDRLVMRLRSVLKAGYWMKPAERNRGTRCRRPCRQAVTIQKRRTERLCKSDRPFTEKAARKLSASSSRLPGSTVHRLPKCSLVISRKLPISVHRNQKSGIFDAPQTPTILGNLENTASLMVSRLA